MENKRMKVFHLIASNAKADISYPLPSQVAASSRSAEWNNEVLLAVLSNGSEGRFVLGEDSVNLS